MSLSYRPLMVNAGLHLCPVQLFGEGTYTLHGVAWDRDTVPPTCNPLVYVLPNPRKRSTIVEVEQ